MNTPKKTLEKTNRIIIHNFPPDIHTFSYLTRVYKKYRDDVVGWEEVEGKPIYFHDLPPVEMALAIIMGNAQNALVKILPEE
jgi:hypothetical protein